MARSDRPPENYASPQSHVDFLGYVIAGGRQFDQVSFRLLRGVLAAVVGCTIVAAYFLTPTLIQIVFTRRQRQLLKFCGEQAVSGCAARPWA